MARKEEPEINEEEDTNYEVSTEETKEGVNSGVTAKDFDPERVLYDIKKSMLGFDKRDGEWIRITEPIARSEFINLYINSIRSLVNFHNLFSQTTADEAGYNMIESLKEITYACVDYGIKEDYIETLVNIYDTLKITFYGIIVDGRGTENVKQVLTAVYQDISKVHNGQNNSSVINWDYIQKTIKQ
jgi:hypothetical protein